MRRTGPPSGRGPCRPQPGAGAARRGGDRQDRAPRPPRRRLSAAGSHGRRGSSPNGAGLRRVAPAVRADAGRPCTAAGPPAMALDTALGLGAGAAPDRSSSVWRSRAVVGGVGRSTAGLPDRRRPVAGSGLGPGARLPARRLLAEPVGMVFGVREPSEDRDLGPARAGRPRPARRRARVPFSSSLTPGGLDPAVRDRIVAETDGNPLALLELPRRRHPGTWPGGWTPGRTPLAGRIGRASCGGSDLCPSRRSRPARGGGQPLGDVSLLRDTTGGPASASRQRLRAEAAGTYLNRRPGAFRHPLVRAAAYRAATARRREAHRALAEATDPQPTPIGAPAPASRSHAAMVPDEDGGRARELGTRAAGERWRRPRRSWNGRPSSPPHPRPRGPRALAAARAKLDAGAPDEASEP